MRTGLPAPQLSAGRCSRLGAPQLDAGTNRTTRSAARIDAWSAARTCGRWPRNTSQSTGSHESERHTPSRHHLQGARPTRRSTARHPQVVGCICHFVWPDLHHLSHTYTHLCSHGNTPSHWAFTHTHTAVLFLMFPNQTPTATQYPGLPPPLCGSVPLRTIARRELRP